MGGKWASAHGVASSRPTVNANANFISEPLMKRPSDQGSGAASARRRAKAMAKSAMDTGIKGPGSLRIALLCSRLRFGIAGFSDSLVHMMIGSAPSAFPVLKRVFHSWRRDNESG